MQPITVFITDKRSRSGTTQDSCDIIVPVVQKIGPAVNAHHYKVSTQAVIAALESKGKISGTIFGKNIICILLIVRAR